MKNKKQQKVKSFYKKPAVFALTITILAAITLISYIAYNNHLDNKDRQRFEIVDKSMTALHDKLQMAAKQDQNWKYYKFCREGNEKFREGLKSCELITETSIKVANDDEARAIIKKYSNEFKQASVLLSYAGEGSLPVPVSFPEGLAEGRDGADFRERETGMKCSSLFAIEALEGSNAGDTLHISFSCSDRSRALYYPERTLEEILHN